MHAFRRLFALLPLTLAASASAQGVVAVKAGAVSKVQAGPNVLYSVPVILDMSHASGASVQQLNVQFSWDNAVMEYASTQSTGVGTITPTYPAPTNGTLTLTFQAQTGVSSTHTIANLQFTPLTGSTAIALTVTELNLGPSTNARVRDLAVCVSAGLWGDANDDGVITILDAQQVARSGVGLSVANPSAVSARGDVTADGHVNVIDAQQLARFSAGLTAAHRINAPVSLVSPVTTIAVDALLASTGGSYSPGVLANPTSLVPGSEARLQAVAKNSSDVDVTPCANIAYASSNTSVATVSSDGVITAVAPGNATITASSGAVSVTQNLTVVASTATALAVQGQPSATVISDTRFTTQPVVRITNGSGATETNSVHSVTATLASGSGSLIGSTTVPAINGVATFTDLRIIGAGQHTLAFTATGLTGTTTSNFGVIKFIAAGGGHGDGCALTSTGAVYCWSVSNGIARLVPGNHAFTSLSGGGWNSQWCGVTITAAAYCWRWIGHPNNAPTDPTQVASGLAIAKISVADSHSCVLTTGGAAYCWGTNALGELGDGTTTASTQPVAVVGGHTFSEISVGSSHTCAIATTGGTYCWGENYWGQLGDGTTDNEAPQSSPSLVVGGFTFTKLDAGYYHTCAIRTTGALYCWGRNTNGELGLGVDPSPFAVGVPTAVAANGLTFTHVSAGYGFTCAVAVGDVGYCWAGGHLEYGWLGNGERWQIYPTPTALPTHLFIDVQAGTTQGVGGVTTNGAVLFWGLHYPLAGMYRIVLAQ